MDFDKIYSEFICWINGILEDDPIPYEITSLVFFINKNFEIGFSGSESENINKVDYGFYFPLESEYFFSIDLYSYISLMKDKEKQSIELLKKILLKLKNDNYFKKFNFFYGFLFDKAKKI